MLTIINRRNDSKRFRRLVCPLSAFALLCVSLRAYSVDGAILARTAEPSGKAVLIESVVYESDGLKVRGKLFIPAGKHKRLPAVVFNHGGVDGIPKPLSERAVELARRGPYVVFAPSYRGEDGSEGEIEVAAGEVNDALNAVRLLRSLPNVDPRRIAMAGTSHGALVSLLAAGRDHSLRAVVSAYGVTNTFTWYKYLVEHGFDVSDPLSLKVYGRGPEDKPEAFRRRAPALTPCAVRSPLLLIYGEKDVTVPPEQGREMAVAMRKCKTPVQFVVVPKVGHGMLFFLPGGKRTIDEARHGAEAWERVVKFLKRYL